MPRKTLILIIVLSIITIGLVALAFRAAQNNDDTTTSVSPTEAVNATAILSFTPNSLPTSKTNTTPYQAQIMLDTGGSDISGAQVSLLYDPAILRNVKFTPASSSALFVLNQNSSQLLSESDPAEGTLTYAVVILPNLPPLNGQGVLGTLEFSINPTTTATNTSVMFSPETAVTKLDEARSILKEVVPLQISIGTSTTPQTGIQSGPTNFFE